MDRRNVPGGGVTAPHPAATASSASIGASGGIKSLADLNRRNQDNNPAVPLPVRDLDGNLIDDRFKLKREDPLFPKKRNV